MRPPFAREVVTCTLLTAALAGCGATGPLYPETLASIGPYPEGMGRIVLLRSDDFANRNVASPVYVRIEEDLIGKLAWRGFLIAQVPAGDVVLEASAKNRMFGVCELPVSVTSGETRVRGRRSAAGDLIADIVARSSAARCWYPPRALPVSGILPKPSWSSQPRRVRPARPPLRRTAAVEGRGKWLRRPLSPDAPREASRPQ